MSMLALAMAACVAGSGCDSMEEPGVYRQAPGEGVDPAGQGPLGVGWKEAETVDRTARPDFAVDLFYPSLPDGSFDESEGPYPVIVFEQGGAQPTEEYYFLADRLVSWGYVVAMPYYPKNLAFFGAGRTSATVDFLENSNTAPNSFWRGGLDLDHLISAGHSLGGVMADSALDDTRFNALVLLASYPQDDSHADFGGPVASIAGREDCDVLLEDSVAGYEVYGPPKMLAIIDGMTHFQFTGSDEEDQMECPPDINLEEAHQQLSSVLIPFLQAKIKGELEYLTYLQNPPEGISVTLELTDAARSQARSGSVPAHHAPARGNHL